MLIRSSRLYKKSGNVIFNNLNPSFVTDNKLFGETFKPFFSNKGNYGAQIKLVEKDEVLQYMMIWLQNN